MFVLREREMDPIPAVLLFQSSLMWLMWTLMCVGSSLRFPAVHYLAFKRMSTFVLYRVPREGFS